MQPVPSWLESFVQAIASEYHVRGVLGRGGMATVLLADEPALRRTVAIKVLLPELSEGETFRARFRREAKAAASLSHPHIVPIHRVGEAAGLPYYVMQYVAGETLDDRLARDGRMAPEDALRVTREVASALRAAHRRGIVHRDVKPQNILLDGEDGRALVSDFGIARMFTADDSGTGTHAALTGTGFFMGTPRYMSPEQAGAQPVGPASDLYSLGIVLYEALTGDAPYEDTPGRSPIAQHLVAPVVPVITRRPDVPPALGALTERLLEKDPAARFTTADDLITAIDAVLGGDAAAHTPSASTSPAGRATGRRRWAVIAAIAAVLVVAAGLVYRQRRPASVADDPRHSLLIAYFENTARDPALEWLRVGGVELLNRSLSRWTDLRLVETSRLLDLARRAKLEEGATMSQADALALARDAGVGTVALGSIVRLAPSRSSVTLRLYDVATGTSLQQLTQDIAADSLVPEAFARLADGVLAVAGAPMGAIPGDEPPTRSLAAFKAYVTGLRAMHRWSLDTAHAAFEDAVRADPAFSLAWMRMGEASFFRDGPVEDSTPSARMLDSAMRHLGERPERERLVVQTANHFMHGRFAQTRASARQLLARDSTSVDGWFYLGLASFIDQFVVPDAAGRDSTGYDPTTAFRALRRAAALDASNHQSFGALAGLLLNMATPEVGTPTGRVLLVRAKPDGLRFPKPPFGVLQQRALMVSPDSIFLGSPAEVGARFSPADEAAAQRRAQEALRQIVDPWLLAAPEEGMAHLMRSSVLEIDGDFRAALEEFERAVELGVPSIGAGSTDWSRMRIALSGKLDSAILAIAARLEQPDVEMPPPTASAVVGGLGAAQLLQGRLAAARATRDKAQTLNARNRRTPVSPAAAAYNVARFELMLRAYPGQLSAAGLDEQERRLRQAITALPDSQQARLTDALMVPIGFPAAYLGDTARLARLRAAQRPNRRALYPGLDALAAAVAGDRARAEAGLRVVDADTMFPWPGSKFAAGLAALRLNDPARALRYLHQVDSSAFSWATPELDPDWVFVTRAAKARGDAAMALGDTALAAREYRRVLRLWAKADAEFLTERRDAADRLTRLGSDRPRTVPVPATR